MLPRLFVRSWSKPLPEPMDSTDQEFIPLSARQRAFILYEDRNVLVIDKPAGWMLAPRYWNFTSRNLQRTIEIAIQERQAWVKKRNLRFLRYVHRLDAETSGVLMLARNRLALRRLTHLFELGSVKKLYVAIVPGAPPKAWHCSLAISPCKEPRPHVKTGRPDGKPASTKFYRVANCDLPNGVSCSVILAEPETGRMHQIRAHLSTTGFPVLSDRLYWHDRLNAYKLPLDSKEYPLALRAVGLEYVDPITGVPHRITAGVSRFLAAFHIPESVSELVGKAVKNWPTESALSSNNRTDHKHQQDVHSGSPRINP